MIARKLFSQYLLIQMKNNIYLIPTLELQPVNTTPMKYQTLQEKPGWAISTSSIMAGISGDAVP